MFFWEGWMSKKWVRLIPRAEFLWGPPVLLQISDWYECTAVYSNITVGEPSQMKLLCEWSHTSLIRNGLISLGKHRGGGGGGGNVIQTVHVRCFPTRPQRLTFLTAVGESRRCTISNLHSWWATGVGLSSGNTLIVRSVLFSSVLP